MLSSSIAEIPKLPFVAVERRAAANLPYETYLRDYVANNRPVVVEGAGSGWPAVGKWTPEFFKTRFGPKMVDVSYEERMPFADFIDGVLASTAEKPGPYMYRLFICVHLPELLPDLDPPNPYGFARRLASPLMPGTWRRPDGYLKLLIGGVGGRFPVMHFDGENMHATITEIHGDKEFLLYPPEDGPYLYPKPDAPNLSLVQDLENPDLARFPLFAQATRYRAILKPGDTIFVPSHWWHTARVLSPSVSVCTNQVDQSNWNGFVREVCLPQRGDSAPKREAKRAVLMALGLSLSALERLGRRDRKLLPASFASRIGRLAPWSPAEAIPQSDWPIGRWRVRGASS
jgi:Cupin-like domain